MARTLELPSASRRPAVVAMGAALLGLTCLLALVATGGSTRRSALMEGLVVGKDGAELVELPPRLAQLADEEEYKEYIVGDPSKVVEREPPKDDTSDPELITKMLGFGAEVPEGDPNPRSVYYNVYEDDDNLKESAGNNAWHHLEPLEDPFSATHWWKEISGGIY